MNRRAAIKTAAHVLVARAGGPFAASVATRVQAPNLSNYGSADSALVIPADVAVDLEALPGVGPIVTAVMADALGFRLVPVAAAAGGDAAAMLARVAQESGNLFADVARALGDGVICGQEAGRLDARLAELELAVGAARAVLRARMDGAG